MVNEGFVYSLGTPTKINTGVLDREIVAKKNVTDY